MKNLSERSMVYIRREKCTARCKERNKFYYRFNRMYIYTYHNHVIETLVHPILLNLTEWPTTKEEMRIVNVRE